MEIKHWPEKEICKKKKKKEVLRFPLFLPTEIITLTKGIQTSDIQETNPQKPFK
jgi:hypothetical protein